MTVVDAAREDVYRRATALLSARTGLAVPPSRAVDLRAAVDAARGELDAEAFVARLEAGGDLSSLVEHFTVRETHFFRHAAQLDFLAEVLARAPGGAPSVWVAGCASGEEAYSLAMLLHERGCDTPGCVVATDIASSALAAAVRAVYRKSAIRGDEGRRALPHLVPAPGGKGYRVRDEVRRLVRFQRLNLLFDPPPGPMRAVLCRNVLIYVEPALLPRAAAQLCDALVDGGWLVLAATDPPMDHAQLVPHLSQAGVLYQRVREPRFPPAPKAPPPPLPPQPRLATPPPVAPPRRAPTPPPPSPEPHLRAAVAALDAGELDAAVAAARRAVYLDGGLVMAHFVLGLALSRRGNAGGARREMRLAARLARALRPEDPLPLGDGLTAGRLVLAAERAVAQRPGER